MKVIVDCKNFDSIDDGNTSTYGGFVLVNNEEVAQHGTDRGDSGHFEVIEKICELFGAPIEAAEFVDIDPNPLDYYIIEGEKFGDTSKIDLNGVY